MNFRSNVRKTVNDQHKIIVTLHSDITCRPLVAFNIVKPNKNCKLLYRPILTSGSDRHSKK